MAKRSRNRNGSRRYGRAWKRIRDKYISEHPICEMCIVKSGYIQYYAIQPATEVHHIIPLCQNGTSKPSNLMALCSKCHAEIHHNIKEEHYENYIKHKDEGDYREEA